MTYIYFTLVFSSTMLHLGLGLSRLTLASRVAQAGTPGALVLNHGAALQQSLQALHTAPRLDMRVSGNTCPSFVKNIIYLFLFVEKIESFTFLKNY